MRDLSNSMPIEFEVVAAEARRIRLTNTNVFVDECFETKADPPCALCWAVERGIAAGLLAAALSRTGPPERREAGEGRITRLLDACRNGYGINVEHGKDIPLLCATLDAARREASELRDGIATVIAEYMVSSVRSPDKVRVWFERLAALAPPQRTRILDPGGTMSINWWGVAVLISILVVTYFFESLWYTGALLVFWIVAAVYLIRRGL
jgi:hypothetical protein